MQSSGVSHLSNVSQEWQDHILYFGKDHSGDWRSTHVCRPQKKIRKSHRKKGQFGRMYVTRMYAPGGAGII